MINLVGILTADLILAQVNARPDFGEEHMVDDMIIRPGALANMIFPLAKLNVKPRVISCLGRDSFGEDIFSDIHPLIEDGITRTDTATALSVSVVKDDGSRFFVTYSGNVNEFTPSVVESVLGFDQARATMFYGYFLVPKFGVEGTIACLLRARSQGQITFFDANSAIDGWSEKSRNEIYSFLPYIDYFMPNDEELMHLTGLSSVSEAAQLLIDKGASTIIVKRGSHGATAYSKAGEVHHAGFAAKAYDTTGAGDSFNAGFIYSLLQQEDVYRALGFGNALASIVVSRREDRYPTLDSVEQKLLSSMGA